MKALPIAAVLALASPAIAQSTSPATASGTAPAVVASGAPSDLPIPIPADATVEIEVDATNSDMLGQIKDVLSGFNAQDMLDTMVVGEAEDAADKPNGVKHTHKHAPVDLPPDVANVSMADLLHKINHVHLVVFSVPEPSPVHAGANRIKASGPLGLAPLLPGEPTETPVAAAMSAKKLTSFYETTFHGQGGRRVVWINYDPVCFIMESFPVTGGTAMVMQMPDRVAVLRSDGNLDLKPVNTLFSAVMREAAQELRSQ